MTAIERFARPSPHFDERIAHARAVLQSAAAEHAGAIVQTSSLGVEAMVLTDLIARDRLPIVVATLDTGRLHAETLALITRTEQRYGIEIERWQPQDEAVIAFVTRHGVDPMYRSTELRKACCSLRKLEPLERMLRGRRAWITGRRRQQSATRDAVPFRERDRHGRLKLNPIADWSWGDVWHYVASREVPYNELHDRHFPSIGCAPCTRAIADGEDFRAGRWWWEDDDARECGLHVKPSAAPAAAACSGRSAIVLPAEAVGDAAAEPAFAALPGPGAARPSPPPLR